MVSSSISSVARLPAVRPWPVCAGNKPVCPAARALAPAGARAANRHPANCAGGRAAAWQRMVRV